MLEETTYLVWENTIYSELKLFHSSFERGLCLQCPDSCRRSVYLLRGIRHILIPAAHLLSNKLQVVDGIIIG